MSDANTLQVGPAPGACVSMTPFLDNQYNDLRKMLLAASAEERQMEKVALGAFGIFYSWLSTQPHRSLFFATFVSLIPCIITSLAIIRMQALTNGMGTIARYLCSIEAHFCAQAGRSYDGPRGWETFLAEESMYVKRFHNSHYWFWYCLLAGTVAAAIAYNFYWPESIS